MADHAPRPIEPYEAERADAMWVSFIQVSKVVIILTIMTLGLMALFLL